MKGLFYYAWIRFNTKSFTGTWVLGMLIWVYGVYTKSFWGKVVWIIFMTAIIIWCFVRDNKWNKKWNKWFEEEAKKLPENNKID